MRVVDQQAGSVGGAEGGNLIDRRDVAFHREDAVDRNENATAVTGRALQCALKFVDPVVAEGAKFRFRLNAAVKNRGVVARVGDYRVARPKDRSNRSEVGLVAGREYERVFGADPFSNLALQLDVQRDRPVQ